MTDTIKRLSIERRVQLIFAFFRDARHTFLSRNTEAARANERLALEVLRQIKYAIRDDRELRDGVPLELSNEELCPACGVPGVEHGSVKAGNWDIRICAGVAGQNLYIIGPDAATAFIEQLKEKDERRSSDSTEELPVSG